MESIYFYDGKPISELFSRKKQARIRYRVTKKGMSVEDAVAIDEGDNEEATTLIIDNEPLANMVTRSAYLRIYNRVLNKTPILEAIEAERAKHPECFLTEEDKIRKKEKIKLIRSKVRNFSKNKN